MQNKIHTLCIIRCRMTCMLMLVRLSPRIVNIFLEYSSKPEEVSVKHNIVIPNSLSIQYDTKLMFDRTNW